jgi:hypothetical protein
MQLPQRLPKLLLIQYFCQSGMRPSEHHAPPSVESMDMEQLHQRIEEMQQGHEKRNT